MERKSMIAPLLADEIIAGLRKKAGGRTPSKNIEIMVRILSAKTLFQDELVAQLRANPDYDCRGVSDKFIKQRLQTLRHHRILGRQDGWFFIKGTIADPEVQDDINGRNLPFNQPKRETGEIRSLRNIIYEILKEELLPLNRLAMRVENHPDYDGSHGQGKKLLLAVSYVLNEKLNKRRFFERRGERKKYDVWQVKADSSPPPKGFNQHPSPKRDELYRIMRTKSVIKGWSYRDLSEEEEEVKVAATTSLSRVFIRDKGERFECLPVRGRAKRWRAKWQGPLKTPSSPEDFKDLASRVLNDLVLPLDLKSLLKAVRQYGYLFGYENVNELPLPFLENSIIRAIAGTKYVNQIRDWRRVF